MEASNTNDSVDELVLNIEKLMTEASKNRGGANDTAVCVYRVPKALSCGKPEAFTPQFVGLGPIHHCLRPEVNTNENLKVASATAVLKRHFLNIEFKELVEKLRLRNPNLAYIIRNCYNIRIELNDDSLLYLMTLDSLFLYDLLHRVTEEDPSNGVGASSVIKGIPKDAILRDVFMLENQIPTRMLKEIMQVENDDKEVQEDFDNHLGSMTLDFCLRLCPLLKTKKLPNKSDAVKHVHLLDLMYYLIEPDPDPDPDPNPKKGHHEYGNKSSQGDDEKVKKGGDEDGNKSSQGCCEIMKLCCYCFVFMIAIVVAICWLLGCVLVHILKKIYKALGKILRLGKLIGPAVRQLHGFLNGFTTTQPIARVLVGLLNLGDKLQGNPDTGARPAVTMPAVTELHKAGIKLEPAKGGFSSIKFDEGKCELYLPVIRLDVNSDVIIRNLVAYELSIKSQGLRFTRFVELMKAIITTAEDVNLLKQLQIIQTELSDEEVMQLFNGMSKSDRPTITPKLEEVIKEVNNQVDSTKKPPSFITNFVYPSGNIFILVAAVALFYLTAMQAYCTVFGCSTASKFGKMPEDIHGVDHANNCLISSM